MSRNCRTNKVQIFRDVIATWRLGEVDRLLADGVKHPLVLEGQHSTLEGLLVTGRDVAALKPQPLDCLSRATRKEEERKD